jgi:hypothetical protein
MNCTCKLGVYTCRAHTTQWTRVRDFGIDALKVLVGVMLMGLVGLVLGALVG